MNTIEEVVEVHGPDKEAYDGNDLRKELSESVELLLEWGFLFFLSST